jgi:hypothetical protein
LVALSESLEPDVASSIYRGKDPTTDTMAKLIKNLLGWSPSQGFERDPELDRKIVELLSAS